MVGTGDDFLTGADVRGAFALLPFPRAAQYRKIKPGDLDELHCMARRLRTFVIGLGEGMAIVPALRIGMTLDGNPPGN